MPDPISKSHTDAGAAQVNGYLLRERIAVSSHAEVFVASSAGPEPRTVVIKRLLPSATEDEDAYRLFRDEVRLSQYIRHPKVVDVFSYGEEAGIPYLVLEYVPGVDLWRLLRWLRKHELMLSVPQSIVILCDVLDGLSAVHEAVDEEQRALQIVHSDVSPSNILLSAFGDVKISDFSIACAQRQSVRPPGRPYRTGKLGYLSPESLTGDSYDHRADLFAVGSIAAELLTNKPLFSGSSELSLLLSLRDADVSPFIERARDLEPGLKEVILRALSRRPEDRFSSARQFLQALKPFLSHKPHVLREELGTWVEQASTAQDHLDLSGETKRRRSSQPRIISTPFKHEEERITQKQPIIEFRVQTQSGRVTGPKTYAQVIEAVATGELGVDDKVSMCGESYLPIECIPDLARHLPPTSVQKRWSELPLHAVENLDLSKTTVTQLFAQAALEKRTQLMVFEHGEIRKEVYLKDGAPQYVNSNLASELLGEYLLMRGALTRGELDMALAVLPKFGGRLGETLIALGLLDPVKLFKHIETQIRQKVLDLFQWGSGSAALYLGIASPEGGFPLSIDPWALLMDGVRNRFERGLEGTLTPHTTFIIAKSNQSDELPEPLNALLDMLERPHTLSQISARLLKEKWHTSWTSDQMVYVLRALSFIKVLPQSPWQASFGEKKTL